MRRERLIAARKAAGRSQEQVAELIGVDRTTIGTWERGEYSPHPSLRAAYGEAIGVSLADLAGMLVRSADPEAESFETELSEWSVNYFAFEQVALGLRIHEPRVIQGLFQTPAYVESLLGPSSDRGAPLAHVEQVVEQRRVRQERVRTGAVALHIIQPEQALRVIVGGAEVMAAQLDMIVEVAALPNVTFQIATYDAGHYEARRMGDFALATLRWGRPRVFVEGYNGGRTIVDAEGVASYEAAFERASRVALSPRESNAFIERLADEWRKNA